MLKLSVEGAKERMQEEDLFFLVLGKKTDFRSEAKKEQGNVSKAKRLLVSCQKKCGA